MEKQQSESRHAQSAGWSRQEASKPKYRPRAADWSAFAQCMGAMERMSRSESDADFLEEETMSERASKSDLSAQSGLRSSISSTSDWSIMGGEADRSLVDAYQFRNRDPTSGIRGQGQMKSISGNQQVDSMQDFTHGTRNAATSTTEFRKPQPSGIWRNSFLVGDDDGTIYDNFPAQGGKKSVATEISPERIRKSECLKKTIETDQQNVRASGCYDNDIRFISSNMSKFISDMKDHEAKEYEGTRGERKSEMGGDGNNSQSWTRPRASSADGLLESDCSYMDEPGVVNRPGHFQRQVSLGSGQRETRPSAEDGSSVEENGGGYTRRLSCEPGTTYKYGAPVKLRKSPVDLATRKARGHSTGSVGLGEGMPIKVKVTHRAAADEVDPRPYIKPRSASTDSILESAEDTETVHKANRLSWHILNLARPKQKSTTTKARAPAVVKSAPKPAEVSQAREPEPAGLDTDSAFGSMSSPPTSPPPSYDLIKESDICEPINGQLIYNVSTPLTSTVTSSETYRPISSVTYSDSYQAGLSVKKDQMSPTTTGNFTVSDIHSQRTVPNIYTQMTNSNSQFMVENQETSQPNFSFPLTESSLQSRSLAEAKMRPVPITNSTGQATGNNLAAESYNSVLFLPVSAYEPMSSQSKASSEDWSANSSHWTVSGSSASGSREVSEVTTPEDTLSPASERSSQTIEDDWFKQYINLPKEVPPVRTFASPPTVVSPGPAVYRSCVSPPAFSQATASGGLTLVTTRDSVVSPTQTNLHSPPISSPTVRDRTKPEEPVTVQDRTIHAEPMTLQDRTRREEPVTVQVRIKRVEPVTVQERTKRQEPVIAGQRPTDQELSSTDSRRPRINVRYLDLDSSGLQGAGVHRTRPRSKSLGRNDYRSPRNSFEETQSLTQHPETEPRRTKSRSVTPPQTLKFYYRPDAIGASSSSKLTNASPRYTLSPTTDDCRTSNSRVRQPPLTQEQVLRTNDHYSERQGNTRLSSSDDGLLRSPMSPSLSEDYSQDGLHFQISPSPLGEQVKRLFDEQIRPLFHEKNRQANILWNEINRQSSFSPSSEPEHSTLSPPPDSESPSLAPAGRDGTGRTQVRSPDDQSRRVTSPQQREKRSNFSPPRAVTNDVPSWTDAEPPWIASAAAAAAATAAADAAAAAAAAAGRRYDQMDEDTSVLSDPASQISTASDPTHLRRDGRHSHHQHHHQHSHQHQHQHPHSGVISPTMLDSRDPAIRQPYTVTQLKLAKNRMTDQLLPRPQDIDMGKIMIKKPFPAEHPYSSHISNYAIFPSFETPEDPKRGYRARDQDPKNDEMPAMPNDVIILNKTKGFGLRREGQALPSEGDKKPLVWLDGDNFDQVPKDPWTQNKQYYPIPPKKYVPNKDKRDDSQCIRGQMTISDRAAVATRNLERDQWETSYDRNYTGLGPANPNRLDNMDAKRETLVLTGMEDDVLKKHGVNTFDPPRPFEGRIARDFQPVPPPHTDRWPNPERDPNYGRKMTLSEKEEHRLLYGTEYQNLPEEKREYADLRWKEMTDTFHPDTGLDTIDKMRGEAEQVPYLPAGPQDAIQEMAEDEEKENELYLFKLRRQEVERNQQMEAQNRWKVLEAQTPGHNLSARKHKLDLANNKSQPKVFYDHEGQYQRERAGLYHTSYDPYKLQGQMNGKEKSGPSLMDYSECHTDALNHMKDINQEMSEILKYSRTLGAPGSVPRLHDQPSQFEAMEPFNDAKRRQRTRLQPNVQAADARTQEKGIILTESTHGESYNTPKFLQENLLHPHARSEPLLLMSHENQDLRNAKRLTAASSRSTKSVQFSDDVMVASGAGAEPLRLASANIDTPRSERPRAFEGRPSTSPMFNTGAPIRTSETTQGEFYDYPTKLERSRRMDRFQNTYGTNAFDSRKSNVTVPNSLRYSWSDDTSYRSQHPGHHDLSFKRDDRFNWLPGGGTPRPQSDLLKIQDGFSKTDVRRRFHENFSEQNPDLRENIVAGKKHEFAGMNAQILRGTPVTA